MTVLSESLPPRYREPGRLGRGAMGDVYRVRDSLLERDVAVKLLAERYAGDASFRDRFEREALTAASLSGEPGIVTIFDVGEWNGRPFIVMEYLPGGSLETHLRRGVPPLADAVQWIQQAARALDAGHRRGVIHRDVKPGNLLLDAHGVVHVADFGIARAAGQASLTVTGTILGTAGYLSPEQASGRRATAASDRYSLAVVAWELLAGTRPFASDSPTVEAAAHANAPVPSICPLRPDLPCRQLDRVFARALAKSPDDRYASCADFVAALSEALESAGPPTQVAAAVSSQVRRYRKRRWPAFALGVAVLLAGVALAAAVTDGDEEGGQRAGPAAVQTVTQIQRGTTIERNVTVTEPAPPVTVTTVAPPSTITSPLTVTAVAPPSVGPSTPSPANASLAAGIRLTDASTRSLQRQRYREAALLARQALRHLSGTGELYEAYALYDLGASLIALGDCTQGLLAIDLSEAIQGHRNDFDRARATCNA